MLKFSVTKTDSMSNSDSDDDHPRLSSSTLAALEEFLKEKEERENLKLISEEDQVPDTPFDENWQLSQFWYNDDTIKAFVNGALNSTPANGKIALVSCPTLYSKLKKECGKRQITLFEYDSRFKIFGTDFIQYDYKFPLDIPRHMSSQYDLVIADPPFLSEECLTKTAVTIKFLTKKNIVLCTGAIMTELAERLLDVRKCDFLPGHKNNLANEFYCYSNFNFDTILK